MAHPLERELLAHAHAMRALARDLVGEAAADDLVQDAAIEALRAPQLQRERLGGWLATVVRRLAGKHRRGEGRRRRREQLAARPEATAPDHAVDDRDSFARLTRAVLALPEPYQAAIFERYLRDRTPTEIAAARGEPVRTVKTRLQRGLAMLREQLDRDGRDWRAAFATAFGIDRMLPASAAAVTGVALMGTATKLVCSGIAVAALVAGTWLALPTAPGAARDTSAREQSRPIAAATSSDQRPLRADAAVAGGAETARTRVAPPVEGDAVIRGVCVDTSGVPVAGATFTLRGSKANDMRMDAWLRQHARPPDLDLEAATGADGRFELRFVPPPPFQFWLSLSHAGCATVGTSRSEIAPGSELDLGTVVLQRGACVRGHVVDADGRPVGNRQVGFVAVDRKTAAANPRESFLPSSGGWSRTAADGTFAPTPALLCGRYQVEIGTQAPLRPQVVEIDGSRDPLDVEIVLPVPAPADTIAGVVVDPLGAPLADATVTLSVGQGPGTRRTESVTTDAEGSFRIARPARGVGNEVPLEVRKQGFDRRTTAPVTWGRLDLRVALEHNLTIELVAVAADDGTPVEDYRVLIDPERGQIRSADRVPQRADGHHDGGRVVFTGLDRGNHRITLVPAGDTFGVVALQPLRVDDAAARSVTVAVPRLVQRKVHVGFADGRPAEGSTIRLADPCGQSANTWIVAMTPEQFLSGGHGSLLRQETTTDERGDAVLRGPAAMGLLLEVVGPTHEAVRVSDVSLTPTEPLQITVRPGATVRGVLRPPGAMRGLRLLAGLPADGPLDAVQRSRLPCVSLQRNDGGTFESMPPLGHADVVVDDDGSFELKGVPAGKWDTVVTATQCVEEFATGSEHLVGSVTVAPAEVTTVELDVSCLLPGELDGLVLNNGVPVANSMVMLCGSSLSTTVRTDGAGRFHRRCTAGEYRVGLSAVKDYRQMGDLVYASERVVVAADAVVAPTFHIASGTVRYRVVDARGAPVSGVALVLRDRSGARRSLPPTDADGITQALVEIAPQTLVDPSRDAAPLLPDEVMPIAGETIEARVCLPADRSR